MYLHICKHGPILFAPTKADPSRGEGSHSPSGLSLSLPCRMVTKKKEKGRKKLSLPEHNPTEWQPVNDKWEKEKQYSPSVIWEKRTFSEAERVGSPSFLGPCNPTSTSPLAERNMQTHFIDFWSFAEKAKWTFVRRARVCAVQRESRTAGGERWCFTIKVWAGGAGVCCAEWF